ncbi:LysR family transcriptional regulator [Rahnella contaminans]|uniref:LysR family transcriptional regulator n=1 Tax=Rahnella contaminans TaxID=2703882 RepID=UPI003C2B69E9
MELFTSKKMKHFIYAMEYRNLNEASDALFITRSPLVKSIADMEEILNNKLFIKKYNNLIPTKYALSLYEKLKPLYNMISELDSELTGFHKKTIVHVFFDISFPIGIVRSIMSLMKSHSLGFHYERCLVTSDMIEALNKNPHYIIFSLRGNISNNHKHKIYESKICLLVSKNEISKKDFHQKLPITLHECDYVNDLMIWIQAALKHQVTDIKFKICEMDLSSMIISAEQGFSMLLLTEKLSQRYRLDTLHRISVKNVTINTFMYHCCNDKYKKFVDEIIKCMSFFF